MTTLCITETFSAAHRLPGYQGLCANLHGHTWKVQAFYEGRVNTATGMVKDFKELKKRLHDVLVLLDHNNLNDLEWNDFPGSMPTAENIAYWLLIVLKDEDLNWRRVRLYESENAYVEVGS